MKTRRVRFTPLLTWSVQHGPGRVVAVLFALEVPAPGVGLEVRPNQPDTGDRREHASRRILRASTGKRAEGARLLGELAERGKVRGNHHVQPPADGRGSPESIGAFRDSERTTSAFAARGNWKSARKQQGTPSSPAMTMTWRPENRSLSLAVEGSAPTGNRRSATQATASLLSLETTVQSSCTSTTTVAMKRCCTGPAAGEEAPDFVASIPKASISGGLFVGLGRRLTFDIRRLIPLEKVRTKQLQIQQPGCRNTVGSPLTNGGGLNPAETCHFSCSAEGVDDCVRIHGADVRRSLFCKSIGAPNIPGVRLP
jgi:hypothetical protein